MTDQNPPRIGDLPFRVARDRPAREAAVLGDRRMSYGALTAAIDVCARALLASGVGKGDRIAMISTPRPEFLIVFLASLRIGAVWVGLNPVHPLAEYDRVLSDARPRLLFGFAALRGRDNRPILAALVAAHPALGPVILFDQGIDRLALHYDAFATRAGQCTADAYHAAVDAVTPDDLASIVYSSGSTGTPKGVMLTQGNLAICPVIQLRHVPAGDLRALCNLPVSHTACTIDVVAYTLAAGGTLVFQEQFDAAGALALVARERITCLLQVTAMLQKILALPEHERPDLSSLRTVLFVGSPMAAAQIRRLMGLGGTVLTGWGLSESTSTVTFTDMDDGIEVLADTVGRACPGYEVRVVDAAGKEVPAGQSGELQIGGPSVMRGYYRDPAATAAALDPDGWLRTGDLGHVDADGRLRITGRIKAMFKSGGYNVWPREVEDVLDTHPAVALSVVVPVPDPVYHEIGCAFVLPVSGAATDPAALAAHCRAHLANYKVPRRFVIRDSLPMLEIGKIDRRALAAEARALADAAAPT